MTPTTNQSEDKPAKKPVAKKAPAKKPVAKKAAVRKDILETSVPEAAKKPAAGQTPAVRASSKKKVGKRAAARVIVPIRPGNYVYALGRRKSASAQTRLYPSGKGKITVNGKPHDEYFVTIEQRQSLIRPLEATGHAGGVDVDFRIAGGGLTGQAEAARLGLARALIKMDGELRKTLKKLGYLTRDAREKERKKYGLKKARRAPQWAKR